jgi:hypothetical protein
MHTMARRWPLDLYLSLHDLSLHLFQNVFTLLKGEPDLLGHDSASATFEFCDLFYGEGLTSEAGFNPDDEFHGRLLGCLSGHPQHSALLLQIGRLTPTFDTVPDTCLKNQR